MLIELQERLGAVDNWDLLALMTLTGTAICTLYSVPLLFIWALSDGGASFPLVFGVGFGLAGLIAGVQYWNQMRHARTQGERLAPSRAPGLHEASEDLAADLDIAPPELRVVNEDIVNAWAIGRRQDGIVFVTSGLLETMTARELEAILAHEMAHLKNRDAILMTIAASIRRLLTRAAFLCALFYGWLIEAIAVAMKDDHDTEQDARKRARRRQQMVAVVTAVVSGIVLLFSRLLSRYREFVADLTAARALDTEEPMASALQTLDVETDGGRDVATDDAAPLYIINRVEGWFARIFATHPSIDDRLSNLERGFHSDIDASPVTTGPRTGRLTKFGLTIAPAVIVTSLVAMVVIFAIDAAGAGAVAALSDPGFFVSLVLLVAGVLFIVSLFTFPWAMLFADGGVPQYGFVAVVSLLAFLFAGSLFSGTSLLQYSSLIGYLGLCLTSLFQLHRIRTY